MEAASRLEAIATSSKKLLGWRSWCSLGAAWLDPDPTNYSSTGAPIQRRLEASQLDGRFARPAFQHGWTNPFGLDPTREAPGSQRLRSNHRTDAGTLSGDAPNVVVTHASKNLETRSDSLTPCSFFEMNILATSGYTILTRPMIIENASELQPLSTASRRSAAWHECCPSTPTLTVMGCYGRVFSTSPVFSSFRWKKP